MVVFSHDRGKGYAWDGLVVLWDTSNCIALFDGYFGGIYGFCCDDFICGNWKVPDLIILDGLF